MLVEHLSFFSLSKHTTHCRDHALASFPGLQPFFRLHEGKSQGLVSKVTYVIKLRCYPDSKDGCVSLHFTGDFVSAVNKSVAQNGLWRLATRSVDSLPSLIV